MRDVRAGQRGEPARVAARTRDLLARFADEADSGPAPAARPPAPVRTRLADRFPVRLDPGRRAALAVAAAVLVAAVASGVWLLSARPRALSVSSSAPAGAATMPALGASSGPGPASSVGGAGGPVAGASGSAASTAPAAEVVVDVAGKVRRPGLYRLDPGSRVDDAVRAAGGPLPGVDLSSLNLAARVVDGQQILVGAAGVGATGVGPPAAGSSGGSGAGSTGPANGPVNLNSASLDQLEALPGVGPVLGQHILDWRTEHGRFQSVDQLNDVTGIGDVKFASLKPLVTV